VNDNELPNKTDSKIIQFPIKPSRINENVRIDNTGQELRENIIFADNLTEGLIVNVVHNMDSNGLETDDTEFVRDITFMMELIKSTIYRDLGMPHPLQDLVDLVCESERTEGKHISTKINLAEVERIVERQTDESN